MEDKTGLITSGFPIRSIRVTRGLSFEIQDHEIMKNPSDILSIKYNNQKDNQQDSQQDNQQDRQQDNKHNSQQDNQQEMVFDPSTFISKDHKEKKHWRRISVVQIVPCQDDSFSLYFGFDNHCCDGSLFTAKLSISPILKIDAVRYVPIPFNIAGILGSHEHVLLSGMGCHGSGIRRVTVEDLLVKNDVYTSEEAENAPFKYHDVERCQLMNPPHLRENKLYISYLDADGKILCSETENNRVKGLEFIALDIRKRKSDQELLNAVETCIDDRMAKVPDGARICDEIKTAVKQSYFLYNYPFLPEIVLRGFGWAVYEKSIAKITEQMKNGPTPKKDERN